MNRKGLPALISLILVTSIGGIIFGYNARTTMDKPTLAVETVGKDYLVIEYTTDDRIKLMHEVENVTVDYDSFGYGVTFKRDNKTAARFNEGKFIFIEVKDKDFEALKKKYRDQAKENEILYGWQKCGQER